MLFNSFNFIIFFIITITIYYALPHRFRWMFLLAASCFFYMAWNPALIVLIIFSCVFNHIFSHVMHKAEGKKKKRILVFIILINFGLLFVFKYLSFVNETFIYLFEAAGINYRIPEFDIILPLGISFYTFQAVGYAVDIYRGKITPEKNPFRFALFITFFPQLVAGPIERAGSLLPQLFEKHGFNLKNFTDGCKYMLLGFFRKVVIADRAAMIVNRVYNSPEHCNSLSLLIATLLFSVQIYCDFCGYSEIALGCAKIFGIDLTNNFRAPYMSKNIREFWGRWHISLSAWFKDYLYIPLGGNRVKPARAYFNLLVTFVVSGMWHGANWTFLIWGAIHGLYQAIGRLTQPIRKRLPKIPPLQAVITFALVTFAWIFFRAKNFGDAAYVIRNLFSDIVIGRRYLFDTLTGLGVGMFEILILLSVIIFLFFIELFSIKTDIHNGLLRAPFAARFAFYFLLAAMIIAFGVYEYAGQFIYFQF